MVWGAVLGRAWLVVDLREGVLWGAMDGALGKQGWGGGASKNVIGGGAGRTMTRDRKSSGTEALPLAAQGLTWRSRD